MQILPTPEAVRSFVKNVREQGKTIGFVPTMGALHQGHASLAKRSVSDNDISIVSIFVNPTQFGEGEDFEEYPRDLEKDSALLEAMGVKAIFAPEINAMYPEGRGKSQITFELGPLAQTMDGEKRPGHFQGVVQVVSKLFNIVRPDRAYFGQKDFQQQTILKALARELFFEVEVIDCPIVRDHDGLALSSRNVYLKGEYREQALFLFTALTRVKAVAKPGMAVSELLGIVAKTQKEFPLAKMEYFEIRDSKNLELLETLKPEVRPVALTAAFLGATRLIDNMYLFD